MRRLATVGAAVSVLLVAVSGALAVGTHSATEPGWTYQGVVTTSTGPKIKHLDVIYDPLGLEGVAGNPKFMMIWGTSSNNQLYTKTSMDGLSWGTQAQCAVGFPSTQVPVYHPEVIYDRLGFDEKKSAGDVHFKMWFYDAGAQNQNWMRYAESADGATWQIYEGAPGASPKNYLEFSGGAGNEVSLLYQRGGTGVVVNGIDQEYVAYQATSVVGATADGAWFTTASGQGGGPTDVCREMIIAAPGDTVKYRAWDDYPTAGSVTSWDSATGLAWSSALAGDPTLAGASWSDFYGGMAVVLVGNEYYMYDTMKANEYSVGLLKAPAGVPPIPEPLTMAGLALGLGSLATYIRRRR